MSSPELGQLGQSDFISLSRRVSATVRDALSRQGASFERDADGALVIVERQDDTQEVKRKPFLPANNVNVKGILRRQAERK